MGTYERIVLRKDGERLTLNGYYPAGPGKVRTFDVLYQVELKEEGKVSGVWLTGGTLGDAHAFCVGWEGVSHWLLKFHGLPLYGMQKADARVMDFLKKRETMMERALMEYVLPKGARKGFPPGRMDGPAVEEVESFADWKRRKEHWESVQPNNVASHP